MRSAWGVEHEVSKSLVGHGPNGPIYEAATKVGAEALKSHRRAVGAKTAIPVKRAPGWEDMSIFEDLLARIPSGRVTRGKGGIYEQGGKHMAYNAKVSENLRSSRQQMSRMTDRDLVKERPRGVEAVVTKNPHYQNAHPMPYGRKGEDVFMVGGKKMLAKPAVVNHELKHAQGRSSWRLAQIQADPTKLAREEARADTTSGTYKLNGRRSHTYQQRSLARADPAKQRAKAAKAESKGSMFGTAYHANRADSAERAREFVTVQDRIDPNGPKQRYSSQRRMDTLQLSGGLALGAGAVGAKKWDEKKHPRTKGKFS